MKWCILTFISFVALSTLAHSACTNPQEAKEVATISNSAVEENSGIDFSRVHKNVFWTLNDANNSAEIFAIDTDGKNLGTFSIEGATNVDWEDISTAACMDDASKNCIYIADTGNNKGKRKDIDIYIVEEPSSLKEKSLSLKDQLNIKLKGTFNFESFSVNEKSKVFYLVSKTMKKDELKNTSILFTVKPGSSKLEETAHIDFSKFQTKLNKNDMIVTSGDFDSETQTLLLGTYGKAFEIPLNQIGQFNLKAKTIEIPEMEKAESIAYHRTDAGLSIFTSSEGLDQPLYEITCE